MSREMKRANLPGEEYIPESWETPRLKDNAYFINGDRGKNYPSGEDIKTEGIPFLTSDNIHSSIVDIARDGAKYITEEKYNSMHGAKLRINDLIYCLRGSVGLCALNKELTQGTIASSLVVIRPKATVIPEFLNYVMNSAVIQQQNDNYMNGSCAANLSAENVRNYNMPFPQIEEQKAIVSFLSVHCAYVDSAISKHQQIIEKLEEYRKAVITQAVTKGLNPNVEMKESSIPWVKSIPAEWSEQPLKILFNNRKNKNTDCAEVNLLSLSYGRIIRKDINSNEGLLPENFSGYNIIEPNDIVLRLTDLQNDHRSLRTGLVTEHGIITSAYVTLCPKTDINSEYYHYLLHSYDIQKVFYTLGEGIRQSLKYEDLSKVLVPVPSRKEQDDIVRYLNGLSETVDKAIDKHNQLISKLQEYKQSLIYNAVTGKIDCTTEASV